MKRNMFICILLLLLASNAWGIDLLDATAPADNALISTYGANSRETRTTVNELINAGSTANGANWYNLTEFTNLATAISTIDTDVRTLLLNRAETLSDNLTIPATLETVCLNGNKITVPTGKNLTINGPFVCPPSVQAFVLVGTGKVTFGVSAVQEVYAEWFQTNTVPGTTDMTAAINAAIQSAPTDTVVRMLPTDYLISSTITLNKEISLIGTPAGLGTGSVLKLDTTGFATDNSTDVISVNVTGSARGMVFQDFGITYSDYAWPGISGLRGRHGIKVTASGPQQSFGYALFDKLKIDGTGGRSIHVDGNHTYGGTIFNRFTNSWFNSGIYLNGVDDITIANNAIQGNDYGIDITTYRGSLHNVIEKNDVVAAGCIRIRQGTAIKISNTGCEPHYTYQHAANVVSYSGSYYRCIASHNTTTASTILPTSTTYWSVITDGNTTGYSAWANDTRYSAGDKSSAIWLDGSVGRVWDTVINGTVVSLQAIQEDIYGYGGDGSWVGIYVDNATDTRITDTWLGSNYGVVGDVAQQYLIDISPNAYRTVIAPTNGGGFGGVNFETYHHVWNWSVDSGKTFKVTVHTEPLVLLWNAAEVTRNTAGLPLNDNEWFWDNATDTLYMRQDTGSIVAGYVDPYTTYTILTKSPYIRDNGYYTKGLLNTGTALFNGWKNDTWNPIRVLKNSDGVVSIEGTVDNGTSTYGTVLFRLPSSYVPKSTIYLGVPALFKGITDTSSNTFHTLYLCIMGNGLSTEGEIQLCDNTTQIAREHNVWPDILGLYFNGIQFTPWDRSW